MLNLMLVLILLDDEIIDVLQNTLDFFYLNKKGIDLRNNEKNYLFSFRITF